MEENKEENLTKEKKKINLTEKVRENPWILSTFVAGVLIVILLVTNFSGGITGKVISEKDAGNKVVDFLNGYIVDDNGITLNSIEEGEGTYIVNVDYKGKTTPVLLSKDGEYIDFGAGMVNINAYIESLPAQSSNEQTQTQDIPKSDEPKVELFVMSHCPYGTQAEKGIIPVVKALGNSIDFYVRFVYYAMHPSYGEVEEQLNQYCIQEEQSDKYINYLECFLEDGDGERCLNKAGIDKTKLSSCVSKVDKQFDIMKNLNDQSLWLNGRYPLFNVNKDLNERYEVQGSPTLVINGQVVSSGRSPADYLNVICQAFNNDKVPETCSTKLSTSSYSPGFGYSESSSSTTAECS